MGLMKELNDLNNIYQDMYTEDENKGYVVTNADKKGNTPAYQAYKAGKKKKDGKPMYRAADHLKDDVEIEISPEIKKLIESGKFSDEEIKEILWSEGYQRNPEKGEEEERKRSKKVRGERTPMPPRGDKRREDFERWYAANVR